jgi:hypothetical protein
MLMLDRTNVYRIFAVLNGTHQGRVMSPTPFNVFTNLFIVHLRKGNIGCVVRSMYFGCLLYADDMILSYSSKKGTVYVR